MSDDIDFSNIDDFNDGSLGGDDSWDAEDGEGFRVDFSEKEASAEAFEGGVIPRGWYRTRITEVTVEESKSTKNPGKPMFAVVHTIQGGPYKGRKLYDRWCLWTGALYSVSQAMKAAGLPVKEGSMNIPPAKWWQGKELLTQTSVEAKKELNSETQKYDITVKDEQGKPVYQNATKGYKAVPADWDDDKGHKAQVAKRAEAAQQSLAP